MAPGDVPMCPESVLIEARCLGDEALSDLVNHCESIETLRGGNPDDE